MSLQAVYVKEEPEWENSSDSCVSEATARAGLHADREIKYELEIGPELQQPLSVAFPDHVCIKVEAEFVKEEPESKEAVRVKEEAECGSRPGTSEPAVPSTDAVSVEIVLPQDAAIALRGSQTGARAPARRHKAEPRPAPPNPAPRPSRECPTCHKQFNYPSQLKMHIRTHTEVKPFSCDICKKQFRQLSHLKTHERIHTGERRYSCDVCKKQFTRASYFRIHERIHTGEKHYTCDLCKKQFNAKSNLFTHIKSHMRRNPAFSMSNRSPASTRRE